MLRALLILVSLPACVIEDPDDWFDGDPAHGDQSLWVEPSEVPAGATTAVTITDDWQHTDFREVWEVRALGDFEVLEWDAGSDALQVVVRSELGTRGEQLLALDHQHGTSYASFEVD